MKKLMMMMMMMMMITKHIDALLKSDELKEPPVVGSFYLVPAYISESRNIPKHIYVAPLINHFHSDRENVQDKPHYHLDYRFIPNIKFIDGKSGYTCGLWPSSRVYPSSSTDFVIQYIKMKCVKVYQTAITPVKMISKSTLKHRCIHKGKCPHRGYDLSDVLPKNGIITCPLHGLQFYGGTKQLIE